MEALLRIKVEGPTLQGFIKILCKKAVESWWEPKQWRVEQGKWKAYARREQNRENKRPTFSSEFINKFLETSNSEDEDTDFQSWLKVSLSSELLVQIINFHHNCSTGKSSLILSNDSSKS